MARKYKCWKSEKAGREYHARWNRENREKRNAITRRWYVNIKKKVFEHYGNQCACCGETRFEFLSIDHINGGGRKHREQLGSQGRGSRFYRWLVKNDFPGGYRTLCYNCNCSYGFFGYCPHE
jgi:hypothetical protein